MGSIFIYISLNCPCLYFFQKTPLSAHHFLHLSYLLVKPAFSFSFLLQNHRLRLPTIHSPPVSPTLLSFVDITASINRSNFILNSSVSVVANLWVVTRNSTLYNSLHATEHPRNSDHWIINF